MAGQDPEAVAEFAAARSRVLSTIAEACRRAGRDPAVVQLVAVSKTVAAVRLEAAIAAGLTVLGENRVQEAESKAPLVAGASWHLIGPLQSNKARRAVELFDVIESVDSADLARRLDRLAGELGRAPLGVYLQVNVDRDEAKAGFVPETLAAELTELAALPNLRLLGLMTVGPIVRFGRGRAADIRAAAGAVRTVASRGSGPRSGPLDGHERRLPGRRRRGGDRRSASAGRSSGPPDWSGRYGSAVGAGARDSRTGR